MPGPTDLNHIRPRGTPGRGRRLLREFLLFHSGFLAGRHGGEDKSGA